MLAPEIVDTHERVQRELSDIFNATLNETEIGMTPGQVRENLAKKLKDGGFDGTWDYRPAKARVYANQDTRQNIHMVPYAIDDTTRLAAGDLLTLVSRPIKDGTKTRAFGVISRFMAKDGQHRELPESVDHDKGEAAFFSIYQRIPAMLTEMDPNTKAVDAFKTVTEYLKRAGILMAAKKRMGYPLAGLDLSSTFKMETSEQTLAELAPFYLTVPIQYSAGRPLVYRQGQSLALRDGSLQRLIRR